MVGPAESKPMTPREGGPDYVVTGMTGETCADTRGMDVRTGTAGTSHPRSS